MKSLVVWMVPAAFRMVSGTSHRAHAQELPRRAPAFEPSVHGGGTYSSDWFESRVGITNAKTYGAVGEGFGIDGRVTCGKFGVVREMRADRPVRSAWCRMAG